MQKFIRALRKSDKVLLVNAFLLFVLGVTIHYSLSLGGGAEGATLLAKHIIFLVVALIGFSFLMTIDYRFWQPFYPWFYLVAFILLLAVFTPLGEVIRGVRAWLDFGIIVWQPVELVKFFLIIALAGYFSKQGRHLHTWRPLFVSGVTTAVLILLTILQPDLGSAIILFLLWLAFVLILGLSKWQIGLMLVGFFFLAMFSWFFVLQDYQKSRLTTFVDPTSDPLGSGYNLTQSIIAIGSGGFLGRGIGLGSQSQLDFLPETQNDFIFAVIGEELGLAGIILLLGLYGLFAWRVIVIAKQANSDFGQLVATGVFVAVLGQATIHIGMNMGLLPITGISLPFISAGGSYLVSVMLMTGIAQSVAVYS